MTTGINIELMVLDLTTCSEETKKKIVLTLVRSRQVLSKSFFVWAFMKILPDQVILQHITKEYVDNLINGIIKRLSNNTFDEEQLELIIESMIKNGWDPNN